MIRKIIFRGLLCLFLIAIILFNIYLLSIFSTKKHLDIIYKLNGEGIYSNIRPLSLLGLITPKSNEIECLFEIYISQSSDEFGKNKGKFLGDVSACFYSKELVKVGEYFFQGVILQPDTKLIGKFWIEKDKYRDIDCLKYEVTERPEYVKFNTLNYIDIKKFRGQDKESLKRKSYITEREKKLKDFEKFIGNSK